MYYYILESPQSRTTRQIYQRLRDILTNLGIGGEMVTASPARNPSELAVMGLERGYSTIVAVGGDQIINQVATTIIGRAVLGIIPIEASDSVNNLVGCSHFKDAAQTLRFRRLTSCSAVLIEPNIPLFLDGVIETSKLAKVSLVMDGKARAFAYFNRLTINRELQITLESTHITESRKVLGLFTVGGQEMQSKSHFHGKHIKLVTDPQLTLKVAGKSVAATPLSLRVVPDALKVITKRGTIDA